MLCLLSLFLGLQRDPVFSRKLHTLCPMEGPQVKDWSSEELIGLEFRDTQFWSNLKPWTKIKESLFHATKVLFNSISVLLLPILYLSALPPKAWLCHRKGVTLPWSHVSSQRILPVTGRKEEHEEAGKVSCHLKQLLEIENSSYWKSSKLKVAGFIPPAVKEIYSETPDMMDSEKSSSVDILYCMKLKKLFCMDTDWAEHLNYFLGAATCKKKKRINQPFSTIFIIFKNKFH